MSLLICDGGGIIVCNDCGYKEKIIASVHHQTDGDYRKGYQCSKCGNHTPILDPFKYRKLQKCECGGKLSRKKPVYCGECGSKLVTYHIEYLT